jgi:hypothetical protein
MLSLTTNCAATVMASPEVQQALAALAQKDAKRGQAPKRPAADRDGPA